MTRLSLLGTHVRHLLNNLILRWVNVPSPIGINGTDGHLSGEVLMVPVLLLLLVLLLCLLSKSNGW